jgi:hypothetical protein
MLGDKLGEIVGTVTGVRVMPSGDGPKIETTFEVSGEFTGDGTGTAFHGAVYLLSAPPALEHLARSALVYELETDGKGNAAGTFWAWN